MIYLATDHRGFELKEQIKQWLGEWGLEYIDCGATSLNPDDDYPDFIAQAATKVAQDPVGNRGIVLGATGQGEAMVCNRRAGVRAAVYYGPSFAEASDGRGALREIIVMSREHNAANVLAVGAAFVGADFKEMLKLWLDTPFTEEPRHVRRIAKIDAQ